MKAPFTLKLSLFFVLLTAAVLQGRGQTIIAEQKAYIGWDAGIDNYTDPDFGDYYYDEAGQTFKAVLTSPVGIVQFYFDNVNYAGNINIAIYSCSSPASWGSLLGTKTGPLVNAAGWVSVDLSSLHVSLTAGNYYGIKILPQSGLSGSLGMNNNQYADGQNWWGNNSGSSAFDGGSDLSFSVAAGSSLPITLSAFTAQKQGNAALLQWSTATEQNSKDFIVQHSANGISWNAIATLPAAGNSNTLRNYSYVHTSPAAGNNYYRLLQTDIDGKSSYSDIRALLFANGAATFAVLVNPVSNGVMQVQVNAAVVLSLYGPDGRLLWKKQLDAGMQSVDISHYGKGVFLLKGPGATVRVLVP